MVKQALSVIDSLQISLGPSTVPACLDVFGGAHDRSVATGWGVTDYLGRVSDTLQKSVKKVLQVDMSAADRKIRQITKFLGIS
ncbi:hypothetical protein MSG28_010966 [Choristoneura fumiferana]|uniref:Uncharacterized protein n=1 Tax=Choristoneura fumiferana TaxID=7141 RepID=A0ACC0KQL1_CHOFU|nr:hypothetical protein MSG28_010966 [Choristoneura fumiferana]